MSRLYSGIFLSLLFCSFPLQGTAFSQAINPQPTKEKTRSVSDAEKAKKEKREAIDRLIAEARSAPPEIAIDTILEVVESGLMSETDHRMELLDECFDLAFSVRHRVKKVDSNGDTDTRSGMLQYGFSLHLDTLSLQCRVINTMLSLNKPKAKALFQRIVIPELAPIPCENPMVYEVSIYYETLRKIFENGFSEEERLRKAPLLMLTQAISEISSPVQLGPMAKTLITVNLPASDLSFTVQLFAKKLGALSSDPRSVHLAMRSLGEDTKALALFGRSKDVEIDNLLAGYQSFLRTNLTKNWCGDSAKGMKLDERVKKEADFYNALLTHASLGKESSLLPLEAKELMPRGVDVPARIHEYWRTPGSKKVFRGIQELNWRKDGKDRYSPEERATESWQREFTDYYRNFRDWAREEGVDEVDFFHQKCNIFGLLVTILPQADPEHDYLLGDYLQFLSRNSVRQESVIEWYWQARVPFLRIKYEKFSPEDLRNRYAHAEDPILRLMVNTKRLIEKYK